MSIKTNPLDDKSDRTPGLFGEMKTANLDGVYLGGDPISGIVSPAVSEMTGVQAALYKQVQLLSQQLEEERQCNQNLRSLYQSSRGMQNLPDPEIAAQHTANTLLKLLRTSLICTYIYQPGEQRLRLLAFAGKDKTAPASSAYLSMDLETIRRSVQNRRLTSSFAAVEESAQIFDGRSYPSLAVIPIQRQETLHGLILLAGPENSLPVSDFPIVEAAAAQLLTMWEYSQQNDTLTDFVQSIATLSVVQEVGSLMEIVASTARRALNASFTAVAVQEQEGWLLRTSGKAPNLLHSLQNEAASFLDEAARCPYTFRMENIKQDERTAAIEIDSPNLRSMMVSPIRINGTNTGLLLSCGKIGEPRFLETDVFLVELLAARAAENLQSCYLNQELRSSLKTTQLLYDLSLNISQAENLNDAAHVIANTAYRLLQAINCGLILFSSDGRKEAEVRLPADAAEKAHPYGLIQQAMESRQTIYLADSDTRSRIAIPIQTSRRCYGALWLEVSSNTEEAHHPTEEIRILINQAAVALERSILLEETRYQAKKLVQANRQMHDAYGQTLGALMRALDVRDSETEGHSERVTELSVKLGQIMGLSKSELGALKLGALLHDIGKIGISDTILLKTGPLNNDEWEAMRQHPQIGASIIQGIPALHGALRVIAFHHERWNGSGYPNKLAGKDIPLLARIFAVVDVFDAVTRDRPYREETFTFEKALAYLEENAGILFDPDVVSRFSSMMCEEPQTQDARVDNLPFSEESTGFLLG
jgi:HD-GYP domain-containing protein (c-di-GMP phosphodiesterase class II)/GAF domain-containing protein